MTYGRPLRTVCDSVIPTRTGYDMLPHKEPYNVLQRTPLPAFGRYIWNSHGWAWALGRRARGTTVSKRDLSLTVDAQLSYSEVSTESTAYG
jgi:hypothetical protein